MFAILGGGGRVREAGEKRVGSGREMQNANCYSGVRSVIGHEMSSGTSAHVSRKLANCKKVGRAGDLK